MVGSRFLTTFLFFPSSVAAFAQQQKSSLLTLLLTLERVARPVDENSPQLVLKLLLLKLADLQNFVFFAVQSKRGAGLFVLVVRLVFVTFGPGCRLFTLAPPLSGCREISAVAPPGGATITWIFRLSFSPSFVRPGPA